MAQKNILGDLRKELRKNADKDVKKSGERFFKEDVKFYGIKTATVAKIAKKYFSLIKDLQKKEIFDLCEELWQSGYMEESFIACNWSYSLRKNYEKKDLRVFEKWVKNYVSNWASCDTLCNHTIGTTVEMYPEHIADLKKWARSKNRWVRRASAVTLIVPAKKGKFLSDIFAIADILLTDSDDMVQKGYGWMLKVASQAHQKEVFDYVMQNKSVMPRTALRYAIEKMPKELKEQAMMRSV
ncbi:MAG: DNA alkylation repair protein [Parcubacteria group bacterium]|jgi:3-methyladenine DNA glycosylase AlkD